MPRKRNSQLNQLRAEVLAAHRAATRKVQRNEAKGIELDGSKYDPRRDREKISRYTGPQLRSYLRSLNNFRSRKTQFVRGARNAPLPAAQWRQYERLQRKVNTVNASVDSQYADIFIDNSGMTVGERMANVVPQDASGRNPAVNVMFSRKLKRVPGNITSEKGLRDLIRKEQKKLDPRYIEKIVKDGRKTVSTFLMTAGRYDLIDEIKKLNTKQFHLLWQYTNVGEVSSLAYELAKARLMPNKDDRGNRWEAKVTEDSFKDVEQLVKWARTVK